MFAALAASFSNSPYNPIWATISFWALQDREKVTKHEWENNNTLLGWRLFSWLRGLLDRVRFKKKKKKKKKGFKGIFSHISEGNIFEDIKVSNNY